MTCTSTQKGKHLNTEPFTRTLAAGDLCITLTHPNWDLNQTCSEHQTDTLTPPNQMSSQHPMKQQELFTENCVTVRHSSGSTNP